MNSGAVELGQLVGRVSLLEVSCQACSRNGRLSVARLAAEYGADMGLPSLKDVLAGNCPKLRAASVYDQCRVHFPQLNGLFTSGHPQPEGNADAR